MILKNIIRTEGGVIALKYHLKNNEGIAAGPQALVEVMHDLLKGLKIGGETFSGSRLRIAFKSDRKTYLAFLKSNHAENIDSLGRMLWEEPKS